jgi:hypothetical protein
LTALVEHDLGRLPNVVVLEREQLQRLTAERDLTGIELRLRASTMLLEGGLRRPGDADKLSITVKLMPLAGGEAKQRQITTAAGDLAEMRRAVVRAVQEEFNVSGDDPQAGNRGKEAKIFANRAQCLFSHASDFQQRKQALPLAEAALALDPTVEHHRLAATMYNSCVLPMLRGQEPSDDLRYLYRAQQIDLAGTELRLRQAAPSQEDVVIGYRAIDLPYGRATIESPLSILKVDCHLASLGPEEHEQRRLLLEINAMCKRKFEMLLELRRRGGAPELEVALLRLRQTWQLAANPDEFLEMLRTHVSALDREFATGGVDRASCEDYYEYLWEQLSSNLMWEKVMGVPLLRARRPPDAPGPRWQAADYRPAFQWLAKHPDPATRIIGYLAVQKLGGTCKLSDKDRVEGATRLLDVFFREIPQDRRPPAKESRAPVPEGTAVFLIEGDRSPMQEAAEVLVGAGKLTGYLEGLFSRAEQSHDATNLGRCAPATYACVILSDRRRDLLNRLVALIDAKAFDPRCAESAAYLRQCCSSKLADLDGRPKPLQEIGPWADYVIRPISITGGGFTREDFVGACIGRSPERGGEDAELAVVWRNRGQSGRTDETVRELIGTRLNIRSGALREVGRCRVPITYDTASMAAGDAAIFLGTTQHGLAVISAEGGQVLDESKGAPGAEIEGLAWLDGRVYLSLSGTIASFDPATSKFVILASSKSIQQRHALDGGRLYHVTSLLSDPQRHCLWISIGKGLRPEPGRAGIWRYTPATDSFELVMEGRATGLSWSDGTLFYSTTWHNFSPGVDHTMGYFQLDPERLTVKPLPAYQLRGEDVISGLSRGRPGDGWVLVGRHIVAGAGRLYTPEGKSYYYDPAKAALPSDRLSQLGESDRRIIGCLGRGFVIVQYSGGLPPPGRAVDAPFLWYVEPREVGENAGRTKP